MARITQSIDIDAPLDVVWNEAADLPSHVDWMADAESIEFQTEQRSGVGTVMKVETVVGPRAPPVSPGPRTCPSPSPWADQSPPSSPSRSSDSSGAATSPD